VRLWQIGGAPRPIKISAIASLCPFDVAARYALQSANLRRPAILYYASRSNCSNFLGSFRSLFSGRSLEFLSMNETDNPALKRISARNRKMRWPQRHLTRGDVMGILFVLVVVCIISLGFWFPKSLPNPASGFGPDWDCKSVPNGEPICIKKPVKG
jgi:hypothetical protein